MGGKASRDKGKRGELQWRDVLRSHGIEARRGRQFQGGPGSPDVVAEGLVGWHCEVKNVETLKAYPSMEQAISDAGSSTPYVAHKRNGKPWIVFLRAEDFLDLLKLQQFLISATGVDPSKSASGTLLEAARRLVKSGLSASGVSASNSEGSPSEPAKPVSA